MVLDKKTNKEIAETTGLKYWEVRDYIQYIGLAGIREEMLGRKPGRRKKDGYNKGKDGPNADRHLCKTCVYRGRHDQVGNCSYIEIEGHSRGMPAAECTVYKKRQKTKAGIVVRAKERVWGKEQILLEQMTKERLLSYRSNKAEILELDYAINNRWKSDTMIGNDVIFDYSKGYPMPQSVTGFDSEKYERLQIRDMERKERLKKECEEIERFVDDIKDSITHRIFRIYFIDGRKNVTLREVGKRVHMGRSGVGKRIENFLKVSRNSHDSHLQ